MIFRAFCESSDYELTTGAEEKLRALFEHVYRERDQAFSDARFVRNLFEKLRQIKLVGLPPFHPHQTGKL
jgi:hypothetical protein